MQKEEKKEAIVVEDELEKEAESYKKLKTQRYGRKVGIPEDINTLVK